MSSRPVVWIKPKMESSVHEDHDAGFLLLLAIYLLMSFSESLRVAPEKQTVRPEKHHSRMNNLYF